jgi:hypothetical protein
MDEYTLGNGLLEVCNWEQNHAPCWELLRDVEHRFRTNLKCGELITERPGRNPMFITESEPLPWSVWRPDPEKGPKWYRPAGGIIAEVALDLLRLDRIERTPHLRAAAQLLAARSPRATGAYIGRDCGPVRAGELLVTPNRREQLVDLRTLPRARWLTREDLEQLRAEWKELGGDYVSLELPPFSNKRGVHEFVMHRRNWRPNQVMGHPLLAVVRPITHMFSEPIDASSDDAAIFELLAAVNGGRVSFVDG